MLTKENAKETTGTSTALGAHGANRVYRVKWYDYTRGFGYLECPGHPDILVTERAVRGREMPIGAAVAATVELGPKGLRVLAIHAIGAGMPRFEGEGPVLTGAVKWVDVKKGFGFITLANDSNGDACEPYDAFLHVQIARNCGVNVFDLEHSPGARVDVHVALDDAGRTKVTAIRMRTTPVGSGSCADCGERGEACWGCDGERGTL